MFDSLITSLGGNYGNLTGYGINLNLSFSFGYDTKYKVGALSPTPIANNGAIAAKAFLDNNNNDIYDKGDELLPNVKFAVDGMTGARATNENGVTFVPGVPAVSKISISPESLDDPSWMSKRSKATIISHPGSIINLEYPISPTGEVEGTVYISNNGQTIGASNVILELVSDKGVLTKTTTSSFDGYYILSEVPFGNYKMRISQAQLERLGLGANTFYKIIINADNSSLENYNFTIGKDIVNKVDKVTKPKVKFKIKQFPKNEKDTEVRDLEDIVNPGKAAQHQTFKFKEQKEKREMIFTPIETPKIKFKVNKIESENTPKSGKKGYVFKKGESPQEQPKSPETKKFNIKNIERKPSIKEIKKLKKESKKPKTTKSKKENKKSSGKSGTNKSKKENKKKKPKAREHTFKIDPSTLN
jgi:hypothetical protein